MKPAVRVADVAAVAGLLAAVMALVSASLVYVVEPILISMQGPDPCSLTLTHAPEPPPDIISCFNAHPDYYHHDTRLGSYSTPASRLSAALGPAWYWALFLAIVAILSSWLAFQEQTRRRRTAISALIVGSVILAGIVLPYLMFLVVGGGD